MRAVDRRSVAAQPYRRKAGVEAVRPDGIQGVVEGAAKVGAAGFERRGFEVAVPHEVELVVETVRPCSLYPEVAMGPVDGFGGDIQAMRSEEGASITESRPVAANRSGKGLPERLVGSRAAV